MISSPVQVLYMYNLSINDIFLNPNITISTHTIRKWQFLPYFYTKAGKRQGVRLQVYILFWCPTLGEIRPFELSVFDNIFHTDN